MTTDELAEAEEAVDATDTEPTDPAPDASTDGPPLEFERKAITVCLVGATVGSVLPWMQYGDAVVYGFEIVYGLAALFLAVFTGALASRLEWNGRAMAVSFLTCLLVTGMALSYALLAPGIGSVLTAASGGIAAYLALGGFLKSR